MVWDFGNGFTDLEYRFTDVLGWGEWKKDEVCGFREVIDSVDVKRDLGLLRAEESGGLLRGFVWV